MTPEQSQSKQYIRKRTAAGAYEPDDEIKQKARCEQCQKLVTLRLGEIKDLVADKGQIICSYCDIQNKRYAPVVALHSDTAAGSPDELKAAHD